MYLRGTCIFLYFLFVFFLVLVPDFFFLGLRLCKKIRGVTGGVYYAFVWCGENRSTNVQRKILSTNLFGCFYFVNTFFPPFLDLSRLNRSIRHF